MVWYRWKGNVLLLVIRMLMMAGNVPEAFDVHIAEVAKLCVLASASCAMFLGALTEHKYG